MPHRDYFILLVLGSFFILLGLAAVFWGKNEEKGYFDAISKRSDVREYLEHWPPRPEPGALKAGGWIAFALGLVIAGMGGAFLLWG